MTKSMKLLVIVICMLCFICLGLGDEIQEVSVDTLEDTLKERKATMLFFTKDKCESCKRLYHKFVITAQTFENDAVVFRKTRDDKLAERFEVTSFPGIVFYEFGSTIPRAYKGDITSKELSKLVIRALRGDFRSLDLKHAVELTKANFDVLMGVDNQCKLVMLHENDDEDELADFEELAEIFGNEDGVMVGRVNVDKQKKLRKRFNTVEYPAYYFHPKLGITSSNLQVEQFNIDKMVSLINKDCGTYRVKDGRLNPFAGLIPEIDKIIDERGKDLYEIKNIKTMKNKIKKATRKLPDNADKDMAEFYLDLIDTIEEGGSIEAVDEVRNNIFIEMDEARPLKMDRLMKKRNIIDKVIDIIGKHLMHDLGSMDLNFGTPQQIGDSRTGFSKMKLKDEL